MIQLGQYGSPPHLPPSSGLGLHLSFNPANSHPLAALLFTVLRGSLSRLKFSAPLPSTASQDKVDLTSFCCCGSQGVAKDRKLSQSPFGLSCRDERPESTHVRKASHESEAPEKDDCNLSQVEKLSLSLDSTSLMLNGAANRSFEGGDLSTPTFHGHSWLF